MSQSNFIISDSIGNDNQTLRGAGSNDNVVDVTTATFSDLVLVQSQKTPVIVDFWAPWCGPCKQLTPILEKTVRAAGGKVKLAKLNIDDHPEIPGQLGIQSVPTVVAFRNGQYVDGFSGSQTESKIKSFIEKLCGPIGPSNIDQLLVAAKTAYDSKDYDQAKQIYMGVLQLESDNADAIAGMMNCYLGTGDTARARQRLESLSSELLNNPVIQNASSAIDLAEQASTLGNVEELQSRVNQDESDLQARLDLAIVLNAKNEKNAAVDQLIDIIRIDREWQEGAGRKQVLQFFEAWGEGDPATAYGRRKLSAVLFS